MWNNLVYIGDCIASSRLGANSFGIVGGVRAAGDAVLGVADKMVGDYGN